MTRIIGTHLKRITLGHLWALVVLLALLWVAMGSSLPTLDFWWHLKAGEVIWDSRSIPRVDTFSYTQSGEEFVYQNWLPEIGYYLAYLMGGFPLLIFLHALVIVLSFSVTLWLAWEMTGSLRLAAFSTLVGEILALRFTNARPQVFSMLLFALFYCVIRRWQYGKGPGLWPLVPLMALWVNLHGAFVMGLALATLLVGVEFTRRCFIAPGRPSSRELTGAVVVLLLLIVATFANPEGWRVYEYVWDVQTDSASQELVTEWQPPSPRNPADVPFFAAVFVGFWTFVYSRTRHLTDLALFSIFAAFALSSLRGIIWFALVLPPILAVRLKELDLGSIQEIVGRGSDRAGPRWMAGNHWVMSVALMASLMEITLMLSPWVRPHFPSSTARLQLVDARIPREAVEFLAEEGIQGRLFHTQEMGDYIIWRLYPRQHSFIDGRVHLYSEELCRDYLRILTGCEWEQLLDKYDIEWVLLPRDEQTGRLLQQIELTGTWETAYEDEQATLFHRGK